MIQHAISAIKAFFLKNQQELVAEVAVQIEMILELEDTPQSKINQYL